MSGFSFGSSTPATSTSTFGFGATTPSTSTTTTIGVSAPSASTSTFGFGSTPSSGTTTGNPSSTFGFGTPGSSSLTSNVAQTPNISFFTPYADLPQNMKENLAKFQSFLNEQKATSEEIQQRSSAKITKVKDDADALTERSTTLMNSLLFDIQSINNFKREVAKELKHAEFIVRTIERMKSPIMLSTQPSPPPSQYFLQIANSFEKRMQQYNQHIEEIEKYLTSNDSRHYSPEMLQNIMRNQHELLLMVASQVAALNEAAADLRTSYLNYRKKYFNDRSDPFQAQLQKRQSYLFSNTAVQQPRTVSQPQPSPAPTTGTSLWSTPSQPAASSTPSLFGSTTTTSSTPSLFGSQPSASTSTTPGFGFGTTTSTGPSTTGTTGFGFGTTSTAPTSFGTTTASGTTTTPSLFGSTQAAPSTSTGFGFGTSAPTTSTPSLFGSTTTTATPAATGGFGFGTSTPVANSGTSFGFGSPAASAPFGTASPGFGAQQQPGNPNTGKKKGKGVRRP